MASGRTRQDQEVKIMKMVMITRVVSRDHPGQWHPAG
jgi:hypothetical protein